MFWLHTYKHRHTKWDWCVSAQVCMPYSRIYLCVLHIRCNPASKHNIDKWITKHWMIIMQCLFVYFPLLFPSKARHFSSTLHNLCLPKSFTWFSTFVFPVFFCAGYAAVSFAHLHLHTYSSHRKSNMDGWQWLSVWHSLENNSFHIWLMTLFLAIKSIVCSQCDSISKIVR